MDRRAFVSTVAIGLLAPPFAAAEREQVVSCVRSASHLEAAAGTQRPNHPTSTHVER
jgi:hypothetical protein